MINFKYLQISSFILIRDAAGLTHYLSGLPIPTYVTDLKISTNLSDISNPLAMSVILYFMLKSVVNLCWLLGYQGAYCAMDFLLYETKEGRVRQMTRRVGKESVGHARAET